MQNKEIDKIVVSQANDDSAWEKPIKVQRNYKLDYSKAKPNRFAGRVARSTMPKLTILQVKPLANFKLWLKFSDQASGEVDLSHLAGKGVFAFWDTPGNFEQVRLETGRRIAWNDEIEMDADSLYLQLTGKQPAEVNLEEIVL
jgi:hypothetical protein